MLLIQPSQQRRPAGSENPALHTGYKSANYWYLVATVANNNGDSVCTSFSINSELCVYIKSESALCHNSVCISDKTVLFICDQSVIISATNYRM